MSTTAEQEMDTGVDLHVENDNLNGSDEEDLSVHHQVPEALQTVDWDDLTGVIHQMKLDSEDRETLLSLRFKLKHYKITLRASYKGGGYQMFHVKDFQRASNSYMAYMGAYILIRKLNGRNPELMTQTCLASIVDLVQTTLDDLYQLKCLNVVEHTLMSLERAQVQLNYLYFVPDNEKVSVLFLSFADIRCRALTYDYSLDTALGSTDSRL